MTSIALSSSETAESLLVALASSVMRFWQQNSESTDYDQLVHRPTLKAVSEGAAPLSVVALVSDRPSSLEREYDFEPRLVIEGSIPTAGVVSFKLLGADWDY